MNHTKLTGIIVFSLLALRGGFPARADVQTDVAAAFAQMKPLKAMSPGKEYTLPIDGRETLGPKEVFLRRRKVGEIQKSGLMSGCGDYALVFEKLMAQRGYQTLIVDGAEISTASLETHFSGHAVVAVRKGEKSDWCLVDSTNLKVLDPHWDRKSPSFRAFGNTFWIGYCGPVGQYPIHNGEELSAFYNKTLAKVPREVFNTHLTRLEFVVDDSLKTKDGGYTNPNIAPFLTRQSKILAANRITLKKTATILLKDGGDTPGTFLKKDADGKWVATLERDSRCSIALLDYFEQMVAGEP